MTRFLKESGSSRKYDFSEHGPTPRNETKKGRSNRFEQADKPHNEYFGYMALKIDHFHKFMISKYMWQIIFLILASNVLMFGNPQYISQFLHDLIKISYRYDVVWRMHLTVFANVL